MDRLRRCSIRFRSRHHPLNLKVYNSEEFANMYENWVLDTIGWEPDGEKSFPHNGFIDRGDSTMGSQRRNWMDDMWEAIGNPMG